MSLVFRNGTLDDLSAFARLGLHSFPALRATPKEWETILIESPHGGIETHWVGEDGGRVVAGCRLLSFRQWIGGVAIPIMGLSTVAISATDRRRGLAALLTSSGLQESRGRGDLATALYPFRDSFYRKLGYGLAGEVQQFIVPIQALPDHADRARVELIDLPSSRPTLARVYDRWAPGQTGQFVRSERAWERVWESGGQHGAIHRNAEGEETGYAVFRYHPEPLHGKRTLEIEEIVWLDRPTRLALYGWIASLSDQWSQVVYRAHPEEAFPEHLAATRYPVEGAVRWHHWYPVATTMYGPMFRLLDVERAWKVRTVKPGPAITLALEVQDAHLPENAGAWELQITDGAVAVTRGDPGSRADVRMAIGIEPLSRIYIGALAPSAAVLAGLATVDRSDRVAALDALLSLPKPWTFDRF